MPPVLFHGNLIGKRVLGVKDQQVSVTEKLNKGVALIESFELVLGIGRIDNGLAISREAIAIGIAAMILQDRPHRKPFDDIMSAAWLELHELDCGTERAEINGKAGIRLLAQEGFLHRLMTAVNAD